MRLCAEGVERPVAIKRIYPGFDRERFVPKFIREARVLCRLSHSNIVSVWGFERDDRGQLLLIMEYVDGVDLRKLLASGDLPHSVVVFIVAEILSGLGYAHRVPVDEGTLGVVHRDLSPHNVLLAREGAVKVSDFGLAKLRQASHVSASWELEGKAAFMSPEQVRGQPLDGRSDLFSVGIILWELLTGARLFGREGECVEATIWRVLTGPISRPGLIRSVPPDIEAVVMRLLDRDPEQRYPDAETALGELIRCRAASVLAREELANILAERFPPTLPRPALVLEGTPVPERRRSNCAERSPVRARRRRRWRAALIALVCVVAAVSIGTLAAVLVTQLQASVGHGTRAPRRSTGIVVQASVDHGVRGSR
jgi:serine/threonine-protein kinase